jgi:hypothetical protein
MRWDAYSATVHDLHERVLERLVERFPHTLDELQQGPGLNSYAHSYRGLDMRGDELFRLMFGGVNPAPHVKVQGVYSPDVAQVIRDCWPEHRVSRADSAFDVSEPGIFDVLVERFQSFCAHFNLLWRQVGDWRPDGLRDPLSGRTFYVGSRTSLCYLRVYEKGLQMLQKARPEDEPPDLNWVRVELEVKPQDRTQKARLAHITPEQAWGVSRWARCALQAINGHATERVIMWEPKETNAYRAVRHALRQYKDSMKIVHENEGGDEAFMRFVHSVWADNEDVWADSPFRPPVELH